MNKKKEVLLKQSVMQLTQQKRFPEARDAALKLVKALPKDLEVWYALAQLHERLGEIEPAVRAYLKVCLRPSPVFAVAVKRAALLCVTYGLDSLGVSISEIWVKQSPKLAEAHFHLGYFWFSQRHYLAAEPALVKALELDPDNVSYLNHLAQLYAFIAEAERAIPFLDRAKLLDPHNKSPHYFDLMTQNYLSDFSDADICKRHCEFGKMLEAIYPEADSIEFRKPSERLRVAYVSQDFRRHSVAYFILPVLREHDRKQVEVFCYSDVAQADDMTATIKGLSDHWCDAHRLSDGELAKRIREDQIDILVDLVGYAGASRVELFAQRAAPIQVTYLGYPNTTGLSRMDYRLTDALSDPPGMTDSYYSETLHRLPERFLCFEPAQDAPEVSPLPALKNGFITFGSFNAFQKINQGVLGLWAEILGRTTNSRLYIKAKPFTEEAFRRKVWAIFEARGVNRERVELLGWTPDTSSHLEHYSNVDIHLDSFPYNGTTTTFEALWQGVPTITLAGENHRSRVGGSILGNAGLEQCVAHSTADYVEAALAMAANIDDLVQLRASLRTQLRESTLMDAAGFVKQLELAYRSMAENIA